MCGSLAPLVSRDASLAIYRASSVAARGFALNPSVMVLRTGMQTDIWRRFTADPHGLGRAANQDGFWGSDQAVISYLRHDDPSVETFGEADGVMSFRTIRSTGIVPAGTRIVSFHGPRSPFEPEIQAAYPWIMDAWQEAA